MATPTPRAPLPPLARAAARLAGRPIPEHQVRNENGQYGKALPTDPPIRGPRLGLSAPRGKIALRGLHRIDKRTAGAKHLVQWRDTLIDDLGGEAEVTAAQRALIELALRSRLYLDHVDEWLVGRETLLTKGKKTKHLIPLVLERQRVADSLVKTLTALGLERRVRPPKSIAELLSAPPSPPQDIP